MIKQIVVWVLLGITGVSASLRADAVGPPEILSLIDRDASVVKAMREARSSQIDVELIGISGAPTLDFATRGRYPIASEVEDVRDRFSDLDAQYIDGVVTLNVPLSDFGRRDAETEAGELRSQAAQLGVDMARQQTLAELLEMGIAVNRADAGISELESSMALLARRVDEAKQRYQGGTGTLATVRTLELKRLELDSQMKEATFAAELTRRDFNRRFDVDLSVYLDAMLAFVETLVLEGTTLDTEIADSQAQLYLEQSALRYEADAVKRSRLPEVTGTLTGTFFNIDSRLGDAYDVVGGLNASLPLVDAGARDAQLAQIGLRTEILQEELVMDREDRENRWDANQTRRREIQSRIREQTETQSQLKAELEELKLRAQTLDSRPVEVALTEVDLGQTEVALSHAAFDWLDAQVEALMIRDELLLSLIGQAAESYESAQ